MQVLVALHIRSYEVKPLGEKKTVFWKSHSWLGFMLHYSAFFEHIPWKVNMKKQTMCKSLWQGGELTPTSIFGLLTCFSVHCSEAVGNAAFSSVRNKHNKERTYRERRMYIIIEFFINMTQNMKTQQPKLLLFQLEKWFLHDYFKMMASKCIKLFPMHSILFYSIVRRFVQSLACSRCPPTCTVPWCGHSRASCCLWRHS